MPERSPFVFVDRVRFGDLDARGHLNNVAFLQLVEAARQAFLREVDEGYDPTRPHSRDLILARNEIDYRAQASWDEDVTVELVPADVSDRSFDLGFRMSVGDRLVAEGSSTLVGFDYDNQEPATLPDALRRGLEQRAG